MIYLPDWLKLAIFKFLSISDSLQVLKTCRIVWLSNLVEFYIKGNCGNKNMAEKIVWFWKTSRISVSSLHSLTLHLVSNSLNLKILNLSSQLDLPELWVLPWIEHLCSPQAFHILYIDRILTVHLYPRSWEILCTLSSYAQRLTFQLYRNRTFPELVEGYIEICGRGKHITKCDVRDKNLFIEELSYWCENKDKVRLSSLEITMFGASADMCLDVGRSAENGGGGLVFDALPEFFFPIFAHYSAARTRRTSTQTELKFFNPSELIHKPLQIMRHSRIYQIFEKLERQSRHRKRKTHAS